MQLPFHPSRGKEEVSRDINHIDDKYHRGDVFHVNIHFISFFSEYILFILYLGSSNRCIK